MTEVGERKERKRRRRLGGLPGLYAVVMRTAVQTQFQYRTANYAFMLGMIAEPVIYLVVWSTGRTRAGRVGGGLYRR